MFPFKKSAEESIHAILFTSEGENQKSKGRSILGLMLCPTTPVVGR